LKDARSLSRSTDFVLDEQEKSDVSVRKPAVQFKGERGFFREKIWEPIETPSPWEKTLYFNS